MLGICEAYDAEVLALADELAADREMLSTCRGCGGEFVRFASATTLYELDRRKIHDCTPKPLPLERALRNGVSAPRRPAWKPVDV